MCDLLWRAVVCIFIQINCAQIKRNVKGANFKVFLSNKERQSSLEVISNACGHLMWRCNQENHNNKSLLGLLWRRKPNSISHWKCPRTR
jgi:hypothetical protein